MQRTIKITFAVILICLLIFNAAIVAFIHERYAVDSERLKDLDYQVQGLKYQLDLNHRWETLFTSREIVTGEKDSHHFGFSTLHLNSVTNGTQRFSLGVGKGWRPPVGAWISNWEPHAEMLKFEEFHVAPNLETGEIELLATPRTNENIAMRFTITVLQHSFTTGTNSTLSR